MFSDLWKPLCWFYRSVEWNSNHWRWESIAEKRQRNEKGLLGIVKVAIGEKGEIKGNLINL
jgi:hypothetical protein